MNQGLQAGQQERQGEVQEQFAALTKSIEELKQETLHLVEKLSPVLSVGQPTPVNGPDAKVVRGVTAPLAGEMQGWVGRVRDVISTVVDIRKRVEV